MVEDDPRRGVGRCARPGDRDSPAREILDRSHLLARVQREDGVVRPGRDHHQVSARRVEVGHLRGADGESLRLAGHQRGDGGAAGDLGKPDLQALPGEEMPILGREERRERGARLRVDDTELLGPGAQRWGRPRCQGRRRQGGDDLPVPHVPTLPSLL